MNILLQKFLVPFAPLLAKHQESVLGLRFKRSLGRQIQNPPESFYDKIFWMSAHSDTQKWSDLADKIKVREYVSSRCGSSVLTSLYAIYDSADQIDFAKLPSAFVIKTNNGCASNYIIRSKADTDLESIRSGLRGWLHFPYGDLTGQRHYSRIIPRILAEELLQQQDDPDGVLVDYKFYCFNGRPTYCYVVTDRTFDQAHTHKRMMYDLKWNAMPEVFKQGVALGQSDPPANLKQMIEIAAKLSQGIPFVRVDLYEVNNEIKFSEMTFMPGMDPGFTEDFQHAMGQMIELPRAVRNL